MSAPVPTVAPLDHRAARAAAVERKLDALRTADTVATQVMSMLGDPEDGLNAAIAVVEVDPIFAARLLRLANSAAYAPLAAVRNVRRAGVMVGVDGLRLLAAQLATDSFSSRMPPGFREHSATAAAACVAAGRIFGVSRADAYTMGLLHDLGWPVLWSNDALAEHLPVEDGFDSAEQSQLERDRFGHSHADISAILLEAWGFAPQLVQAVRDHHSTDPDRLVSSPSPFAKTLAIGDVLAQTLGSGPLSPHQPVDLATLGFSSLVIAELLASTRDNLAREVTVG
ncbi:MAG: HDOD domain-containing protein [Acidimicrobiales bacterium]